MRNNHSTILTIARKEFLHIIHDPRTLLIVFLLPVIQLIMFGYALNTEIQNVELAVMDFARSPQSRELIRQFSGSPFFETFDYQGNVEEIDELFKYRKAGAIMIIPVDYGRQLQRRLNTDIQFIIDASDANAATFVKNYCNRVIAGYNETKNQTLPLPFEIESAVFFNPDMKSSYFFVPGLMALLLVMISALLTSIAITREKETGTLEQILVSPVKPHQIIVGKVLPYILLAFLSGIMILSIGMFLFTVPFVGSLILLLLLTTLYIVTALSLGLMISTVSQTQQVAIMIALTATLLPTIMLSGFMFPIASMPKILQMLTYIIPARYYLLIVRGIILKGSSFTDLLQPTLLLSIMTVVLLTVATRKFRINLEK